MLLPGGLRLPLLGCEARAAAAGVAAGVRHVRCGTSRDAEGLAAAAAAVKASPGVFVSAKCASDEHADPRAALEKVLAATGLERVDLFSLEWPVALKAGTEDEMDTDSKLEDTWRRMEALVDAGLARAIGVTNFSVPQVEAVGRCARVKPLVNECELHPLLSQRKLVGVCRRYGLALTAHTPLAGGDARLLEHPAVKQVVASSGRTAEEILLRWSVQRGVAAVADTDDPATLARVADGAFTFRLTNAEKAALDAVEVRGQEVRTVNAPFKGFAFDDPFLGGAARPGLMMEAQQKAVR